MGVRGWGLRVEGLGLRVQCFRFGCFWDLGFDVVTLQPRLAVAAWIKTVKRNVEFFHSLGLYKGNFVFGPWFAFFSLKIQLPAVPGAAN